MVSVKCTMYAANNEVIRFYDATFDSLFGMKGEGKQTETALLIHLTYFMSADVP